MITNPRVRVFASDGSSLDPTTASRARKLIRDGQASPGRDDKGFFVTMTVSTRREKSAIPQRKEE